jgi:nitroreductase
MSKKEKTGELEVNNIKELDQKLAEAIQNSPNKPTDEEVEAAKTAFEEASKDFAVKSWDIGVVEDAQTQLDYMQHYVRNRLFWTKNGWMGVLKMDEELEDAQNFLKANTGQPLKLGYQAMEFMFYSLQNPGGVGLQAAKDFEQENEIYAKCFDSLGSQVADARQELKDIQFLQDQYAAMAQGFYLEVEPGVEEEGAGETKAPVEEEKSE